MKCNYVTAQFFIYDQHSVQREANHLDMQTTQFDKKQQLQKTNKNNTKKEKQQKNEACHKSEYQLQKNYRIW